MANSPEYQTIIKLTPELTNAFKSDLVNLSGEFLSAGFISNNNAGNLQNQHNGADLRAASLVGWIRDRIQLDPKDNYLAFIDVLKQRLADHKSILRHLDKMYKELNGTVETGISVALADGSGKASDLNGASQGSKKASKSDSTVKFDPLNQVVDYGSKAPVHIGQIAEVVREWEGRLSDGLELSPADVRSIKTMHDRDLKGQTREALLMWKERKGRQATYNNLIRIFEGAENQQCADFIRHNLTSGKRVEADFSAVVNQDPKKGGHGLSKLAVGTLVLLTFAVGSYIIYSFSTGNDYGTPSTETVRNRERNSHSKGDDIQKLNDLIQAVQEIGDWQGLCTNLGVNEGKIDSLIHSTATVDTKKAGCLRAYFNGGEAKWSNVIKAVAMHPINNIRVAKQIAEDHGLSYNNVMKDEL